ncbi:hypothetical protein V5O48_001434 [Marasmius crinis-equi]|uniref:NmrA-like domain-containing protein n=1 Tax=Marasmius crinis-equi TaxID=585013 RepID=A0ABR3FYK4_9AGAR
MPKSMNIAVAGGSHGIGRYIVEQLLCLKSSRCPYLHIIVLSRSGGENIVSHGSSAQRVQVDYDDADALTALFRNHNIDTIICTLITSDFAQFSALQERMLRAALEVPSFRRFAPSEFGVDSEAPKTYPYKTSKLPILRTLRSIQSTHPGFEWTKFVPGVFINYFGIGNPKPDEEKAFQYLNRMPPRIDIASGTADIPGDGNAKQFYTLAEDMARFVAEATQLDVWPEQLDAAGDEIGFNDIIRIAERITGKKFKVQYHTKEDILAVANIPPKERIDYFYLAQLSVIVGETGQGKALNELFPYIKPTTVEEFLEKWWGKEN